MASAVTTAPRITEKVFTGQVVGVARMLNYLVYHTFLSVRSAPGFPDLVLVRPDLPPRQGRLVFIELKAEGKQPSPLQFGWLNALRSAGAEAYWWAWTPTAVQEITDLLAADTRP